MLAEALVKDYEPPLHTYIRIYAFLNNHELLSFLDCQFKDKQKLL